MWDYGHTRPETAGIAPYGLDTRTWLEYKAKLAKKRLAVMDGLETITKTGFNEEEGYAFTKESDLNDMMRSLLVDNGLGFDIEYGMHRMREGSKNITEVLMYITWTDIDTGYFEVKRWMGAGLDYNEKGIYKGYTGASKYYLLRNFLASQEETDPETVAAAKVDKPQEPRTISFPNNPEITKEMAQEISKKTFELMQERDIPADAITPEQVGQIKLLIEELAAFSSNKNRKKAKEAVYVSLGTKEELRKWEALTKGKTEAEKITLFKADEADKAIEYLTQWVENKHKQKAEAEAAAGKESEGPADE